MELQRYSCTKWQKDLAKTFGFSILLNAYFAFHDYAMRIGDKIVRVGRLSAVDRSLAYFMFHFVSKLWEKNVPAHVSSLVMDFLGCFMNPVLFLSDYILLQEGPRVIVLAKHRGFNRVATLCGQSAMVRSEKTARVYDIEINGSRLCSVHDAFAKNFRILHGLLRSAYSLVPLLHQHITGKELPSSSMDEVVARGLAGHCMKQSLQALLDLRFNGEHVFTSEATEGSVAFVVKGNMLEKRLDLANLPVRYVSLDVIARMNAHAMNTMLAGLPDELYSDLKMELAKTILLEDFYTEKNWPNSMSYALRLDAEQTVSKRREKLILSTCSLRDGIVLPQVNGKLDYSRIIRYMLCHSPSKSTQGLLRRYGDYDWCYGQRGQGSYRLEVEIHEFEYTHGDETEKIKRIFLFSRPTVQMLEGCISYREVFIANLRVLERFGIQYTIPRSALEVAIQDKNLRLKVIEPGIGEKSVCRTMVGPVAPRFCSASHFMQGDYMNRYTIVSQGSGGIKFFLATREQQYTLTVWISSGVKIILRTQGKTVLSFPLGPFYEPPPLRTVLEKLFGGNGDERLPPYWKCGAIELLAFALEKLQPYLDFPVDGRKWSNADIVFDVSKHLEQAVKDELLRLRTEKLQQLRAIAEVSKEQIKTELLKHPVYDLEHLEQWLENHGMLRDGALSTSRAFGYWSFGEKARRYIILKYVSGSGLNYQLTPSNVTGINVNEMVAGWDPFKENLDTTRVHRIGEKFWWASAYTGREAWEAMAIELMRQEFEAPVFTIEKKLVPYEEFGGYIVGHYGGKLYDDEAKLNGQDLELARDLRIQRVSNASFSWAKSMKDILVRPPSCLPGFGHRGPPTSANDKGLVQREVYRTVRNSMRPAFRRAFKTTFSHLPAVIRNEVDWKGLLPAVPLSSFVKELKAELLRHFNLTAYTGIPDCENILVSNRDRVYPAVINGDYYSDTWPKLRTAFRRRNKRKASEARKEAEQKRMKVLEQENKDLRARLAALEAQLAAAPAKTH